MLRACFLGTGFYVPERVVTNDDLARAWTPRTSGSDSAPGSKSAAGWSRGETGAMLALRAARRRDGCGGDHRRRARRDRLRHQLRRITSLPGGGVYLQRDLGAGPIPAIDIRTQCSGFVYALCVADGWIRTGTFGRVLVVGCEIQSTGMDVSTAGRNTAVIFADGAGAAVLGASEDEDRGILAFDLHSDGSMAEFLWVDAPGSMYHPRASHQQIDQGRQYLQMDGREVFRHAATRMPESVRAALQRAGLTTADIKVLLPHQANLRISEAVQKGLGLGTTRSITTSSASATPPRPRSRSAGRVRPLGPDRPGRPRGDDRLRVRVHVGERGGEMVAGPSSR